MKKNYTQPQLECIEFAVELGFATSAINTTTDGTATSSLEDNSNPNATRFNHKLMTGEGTGMNTSQGSTTGWF